MTWRLVFNKVATLTELENTWSYDDMLRACAILDQKEYIHKKEIERQKKEHDKAKRQRGR